MQAPPKKVDFDAARIALEALGTLEGPHLEAAREALLARILAAHRARTRERLLKPFFRFAEAARYSSKELREDNGRRGVYDTVWRQMQVLLRKAAADGDEPG